MESCDWDEIAVVTNDAYMPYRVTPTGSRAPASFHYAFQLGGFTLSRFRYGAGVVLDRFEPESGRGIVLTTLNGEVRHREETITSAGESFAVDVSRSPYVVQGGDEHVQLNLVFPHDLLAELYERWHGVPADPRMWRLSFKLGGPGSSWLTLLEYCMRCVAEMPEQLADGPLGRHLEETIGLHLMSEWSRRFDDPARNKPNRGLAPRYVTAAEEYLREHARSAPTLTDVADAVGVSVRALTNAFRRHRDQSPISYLRDIRMNGVRGDLIAADPSTTVASVLTSWGYVNQGVFASAYQQRFGETPSATLGRFSRRR